MEQIAIVLNLTSWGVEFTSPILDIYMPWLSVAIVLISLGTIGTIHAIKTIKGNK